MTIANVDVANMALDILTEAPITALTDDVKAARLLNRHFDQTVKAEQRAHKWTFAIATASLTVTTDLGTDSGTLRYKYTPPTDALRLLPLKYDDQFEAVGINWEQRDGFLYSDQSGPRTIRYIKYISDPNLWDALFLDVVVAALAIKAAHPLTGKASMIQIAQGAYDRALMKAYRNAAIEQTGRLYKESWGLQRGDYRSFRA